MNLKGVIYKTTNLINGKIYIGQYSGNNKNYLGSGKVLKRAIEKYGRDNFVREILEECDSILLDERETYWIQKLNSFDKKIGYNMTDTGRASFKGKQHSEETKKILSLQKMGEKNPRFGIPLSDEQKASFTSKGLERTNTWRANLSKSKLGDRNPAYGKEAHNKGIPMSEEAKLKMREAAILREKLKCPHCDKICSISHAKRYHFDNCKFKTN